MFISCFSLSLRGRSDLFVDLMPNLMTCAEGAFCSERVMKMDKLSKYGFCIIQSFLSEKEVKSSVRGFFVLLIC